jgi:hypothetical protein
MSLIQDMYKDGDPDTRRAISQAWVNVRSPYPMRALSPYP